MIKKQAPLFGVYLTPQQDFEIQAVRENHQFLFPKCMAYSTTK